MGAGQSQEQRVTFEKQPDGGVFVLSNTSAQDSNRIEDLAQNDKVKKLMHKAYTEGMRHENERMERMKFQEISELNANWQEEVDKLKQEAEVEKKVTEEEFNKAAEEFGQKFKEPINVGVCQDLQDALVECLSKNNSKPLICSKEVQAFSKCVDSYKLKSF
ncbi:MICOS complex subunit Mic19 [Trichoplax sp. H2]|nr:MICOS complex subunit Mic19 [Trichoplax sp. H2]|eukprot:RDD37700.1 MICOS complex subunit Mic19 [Trichoplax sp. H2]